MFSAHPLTPAEICSASQYQVLEFELVGRRGKDKILKKKKKKSDDSVVFNNICGAISFLTSVFKKNSKSIS